jgi:hypothetical protein
MSIPEPPEFNLYSSPGPIQAFGWEGLRRIMEENAPELRKLSFIRPEWMLLLIRKGVASLDEPTQVFKVSTDFGTLVLCPIIDRNGYRSIAFRFEDEPSPAPGSTEWADQWGQSMGWPKKQRRWPGTN